MNEIAKVKKEVKLSKWAEMIQQRNESGLTVADWCRQNGINLKTYYYRLKRPHQGSAVGRKRFCAAVQKARKWKEQMAS